MIEQLVIEILFCVLPPLSEWLRFVWAIYWPSYTKSTIFGENGH